MEDEEEPQEQVEEEEAVPNTPCRKSRQTKREVPYMLLLLKQPRSLDSSLDAGAGPRQDNRNKLERCAAKTRQPSSPARRRSTEQLARPAKSSETAAEVAPKRGLDCDRIDGVGILLIFQNISQPCWLIRRK